MEDALEAKDSTEPCTGREENRALAPGSGAQARLPEGACGSSWH